jgi:hypothetical protein
MTDLVTRLQRANLATLERRHGFSVSDTEHTADLETLELDLDQLELDLTALQADYHVVETSMTDLQRNDYSAYCAVYECINGHAPLLQRQAD